MGHQHDWLYQRTEMIRNTWYYIYRCTVCGQEKQEPA